VNYPDLTFAIDVSGTPYGTVIIGCISILSKNSSAVISNFKKNFRKYWGRKGKDLRHSNLIEILDYLEKEQIRSSTLYVTANDWNFNLKKTPKVKAYRTEKLFGILYFLTLRNFSKPKKSYPVVVCEEKFMDIDTVISSCRNIAKMRGMDFSFSKSSGRYNDYVKIADYVASMGRKIKPTVLNKYQYHFHRRKIKIPDLYINKVFK